MGNGTIAPGVRELLRDALGPDVDDLSAAALRRIRGALFMSARRELDRAHRDPDQLDLVALLAANDD